MDGYGLLFAESLKLVTSEFRFGGTRVSCFPAKGRNAFQEC